MKCGHHIIKEGCRECESVQKEWYRKLRKETEFKEIESVSYEDRPLKGWSVNIFGTLTSIEVQAIKDKYDRAIEFLNKHCFENETIKRIWALHSEGMSLREIEEEIKDTDAPYKKSQVQDIIKNLEREFEW